MTQETPHPISLEQVLFLKVQVAAVPGHVFQEDANAAEPENSLQVQEIEGDEGRYQAMMTTVVNPEGDKNYPYQIDVQCMAILHADDTLDKKEALRGVTITAHSVLFGAIRETVAWLTGRQPYGPLMLGLSVLRPRKPQST